MRSTAAGEAGNLGDSWSSEQKGRGRERGRRGEGSLLHPHLSCSFGTQPRGGTEGGTQSNKLIPKVLCPARVLGLQRGEDERGGDGGEHTELEVRRRRGWGE